MAAVAHALPDLPAAYAVTPGSDLDAALPPGAQRVAVGPGRRTMAAVLRGTGGRYAALQTHGARALLAATAAGVPGGRVHHVFHELPEVQGRRGWLEVALALRVRPVANSPELAAALRRYGIRPIATLLPVVPLPEPLPRTVARERLGVDPSALAIGVIGRLDRAKSPQLAVEAAAQLPAVLRERALVVFVGDGPLRASLAERAARRRVRVRLAGHVGGASALLRAFDAVAVPGSHETFGLTLAEAILAGVPVAAVDSWGSRTITDGGRLLPLARPRPVDLANALEAALTAPESARVRLARHVAARFCGPEAAASHAALFERALRAPP